LRTTQASTRNTAYTSTAPGQRYGADRFYVGRITKRLGSIFGRYRICRFSCHTKHLGFKFLSPWNMPIILPRPLTICHHLQNWRHGTYATRGPVYSNKTDFRREPLTLEECVWLLPPTDSSDIGQTPSMLAMEKSIKKANAGIEATRPLT